MSISVKICGIRTEAALDAAIEAGADYAGFVFYRRSPRHIELERAAALAQRAKGRIETVALTVNASDDDILAIMAALKPGFLQLHGDETPERVQAVKDVAQAKIIKAVKIGGAEDLPQARAFEAVSDIILFDARADSTPNALPGGNGVAFDWTLLRSHSVRQNFMLSGGLSPANLREALDASGARAVDVSSGVETAPGEKSPELIRRFVEQAKHPHPAIKMPERAV
jgi:phosphoribosylanthranilate isomerase